MSEVLIENPEHTGSASPAGEGDEITLLGLLIILAKHKLVVMGVPLAFALCAAVYSLTLPNTFTAAAKILPPQQSQSSASAVLAQLGAAAGVRSGGRSSNDLYISMLKSRPVLDNLRQRYELAKAYGTTTPEAARNKLLENTAISAGRDGIITIQVDDLDPKRAAVLANAYVDELYGLTNSLAVTEASQRRLFFEKQLKLAKEALTMSELALKETQQATGLIKLDEQARAVIESVGRLRAEIATKEVQLFAMRTFATEQNAEFIQLTQQLSGLKAQLAKLEKTTGPNADAGDTFVSARRIPEAGLEFARRLRDLKYHETVFDLMAKQYELAKVDEARDASLIQVLESAIPPLEKSKPSRTRTVILSGLVGCVFAVLLAFLLEAAARGRHDPKRLEQFNLLKRYLLPRSMGRGWRT